MEYLYHVENKGRHVLIAIDGLFGKAYLKSVLPDVPDDILDTVKTRPWRRNKWRLISEEEFLKNLEHDPDTHVLAYRTRERGGKSNE